MKVSDKGGGGDFPVAPVGTHLALCTSIVDVGTQTGEYQGEKTVRRQVVIGFELVDELMDKGEFAGKPYFVSKFYTASLHEKARLRLDLENWRQRPFTEEELKGFELKNVLGQPCMVTVTLSEKGKAKISSVSGVPKSLKAAGKEAKPSGDLRYFSLDEFSQADFDKLTKGYKRMIEASPEYLARNGQSEDRNDSKAGSPDDDIPF